MDININHIFLRFFFLSLSLCLSYSFHLVIAIGNVTLSKKCIYIQFDGEMWFTTYAFFFQLKFNQNSHHVYVLTVQFGSSWKQVHGFLCFVFSSFLFDYIIHWESEIECWTNKLTAKINQHDHKINWFSSKAL